MPSTTKRQDNLNELQDLVERTAHELRSTADFFGSAHLLFNDTSHMFELHATLDREDMVLGSGYDAREAMVKAVCRVAPDLTSHMSTYVFGSETKKIVVGKPRGLKTIGISAPSGLWDAIDSVSNSCDSRRSKTIRRLLTVGMDLFDQSLKVMHSSKVKEAFEDALSAYRGDTRQVMARVDDTIYCEAAVAANEHSRALSSFSAACLAMALKSECIPLSDEEEAFSFAYE